MKRTHSFGYWVRRQRKALDLTQRELAERAACSLSAVKKIESDARRPSRELAESLAEALAIAEAERELFLLTARGQAPVDQMPLARQPLAPAAESERDGAMTGNLPAAASPLFGREEELGRLSGLIAAGDTRLVTLIGPGGVGKSRLALEAARRAQGMFEDGAWFVPLAGVDDPGHLVTAIAVTLGLNFAGPLEPAQQLLRQLQNRRLLLLLDNLEQLLPEGAELVSTLIQGAPRITVLVTSRERLRLSSEAIAPIDGLSPEAARALFVDRAERVGAEVTPAGPGETMAAIDGICLLVGYLPLAIELAAPWSRLLSPDEILADLEGSHDLLAGDLQDLPERHRSIQAVLEGSWGRLPAEEQELLAGLSVFAGSFTRDAAESVCGAALLQLATLHDHSLIQREKERFHLHALIRQFAAEKLAGMPERLALLQDGHASYYAGFLGRLSGLFKSGGAELAGWELAVDGDMDNIRLAWQWAIKNDQPQRLLPAALALYLYQDFRGQAWEGAQMSAALGRCAVKVRGQGAEDDAVLRRTQALALLGQGALGIRAGQLMPARQQLEEAHSLLAGLDAPNERIALISLLGLVAIFIMERDAGQRAIEETLALARQERHAWGWPLSLNFLGLLHLIRGQAAEARDTFAEAVALWRNEPGLAWCKVRSMVHLGLAHHALGDYETAISTQEDAFYLAQEVKDYSFVPLSLCNLAFHHYAQGELEMAKGGYLSALEHAQRFDLLPSVAHSVAGLGLVTAAQGLPRQAVTLIASSLALPGSYFAFLLGEPQRVLAQLQGQLSPEEFAAAEAWGREKDLAEVIALL